MSWLQIMRSFSSIGRAAKKRSRPRHKPKKTGFRRAPGSTGQGFDNWNGGGRR